MNGSLITLMAAAEDKQRFSAEERDVLFAALVDAVRLHEGRHQVLVDGQWHDSAVAERLAEQGMFAPADGHGVTPADEAMLLLGFMVKHRALTMAVGEREANMVCAERLWDGPMDGEADRVLLTGDGRGYDRSGWCSCQLGGGDSDWDDMVQFERWSKRGREAHGWLHRTCRRLSQSG